jgi:hypothetical protein
MDNENIPSVELDKTFEHIIENYSFGDLPDENVIEIFKDGRAFSHFIEPWLAKNYPINHVTGCKKYDHNDANIPDILYDQKTFTHRGCKFMPSNMIGEGRKFDEELFKEKASKLIYIIVSNIHFPRIKVRFVRGSNLVQKFPRGIIPSNKFDEFFH